MSDEMKVSLTWFPVGEERTMSWPDGWPLPSVGDTVHLPDDDEPARTVRGVDWDLSDGSVEITLD